MIAAIAQIVFCENGKAKKVVASAGRAGVGCRRSAPQVPRGGRDRPRTSKHIFGAIPAFADAWRCAEGCRTCCSGWSGRGRILSPLPLEELGLSSVRTTRGKLDIVLPSTLQKRWLSCNCLVPANNDIHIKRIELNPTTTSRCNFRSDESRA
jgi:hypothetical protein